MIDFEEQAVGSTALSQQVECVEAVAPGQQQQDDGTQGTEVATHVRGRGDPAALHAQTPRERVQHDNQRGHRHDAYERPEIQRFLDGQPVQIEAEIAPEHAFDFPEGQPVPQQRKIHPVGERNREHTTNQQRQHHRDRQQPLPRDHRGEFEIRDARRHRDGNDRTTYGMQIGEGKQRAESPGPALQYRRVDDLLPKERG